MPSHLTDEAVDCLLGVVCAASVATLELSLRAQLWHEIQKGVKTLTTDTESPTLPPESHLVCRAAVSVGACWRPWNMLAG